jgi:hypothetical protein
MILGGDGLGLFVQIREGRCATADWVCSCKTDALLYGLVKEAFVMGAVTAEGKEGAGDFFVGG